MKKSALVFLRKKRKHLVEALKIKAFIKKYEQKFSLFLKPSFRETKIPPPFTVATMPSCQATDLLWWIATETDVNKIINPITLLNTGSGLEREQELLFRLKRSYKR